MNGTTLKALRLALGFTQEEASNMIGGVAIRTWRYWEDEGKSIPGDVQIKMRELIGIKYKLSGDLMAEIDKWKSDSPINLTYYPTLDSWMTQLEAEPIHWKPHCMAMSVIAEYYPNVKLIAFDAVAYQKWLGSRVDNSAMRGHWAGLQS